MNVFELSNVETYRGGMFANVGPMHSEKTLQSILLNRRINTHTPHRSLLITNDINTRDGKDRVASAAGLESDAITIPHKNPWKILEIFEAENNRTAPDKYGKTGEVDLVIFSEVQFLPPEVVEVFDMLRLTYPKLIQVYEGLCYNIRREVFNVTMEYIASNAKHIAQRSNCKVARWGKPCGKLTDYTTRFINLKKYPNAPTKPVDIIDKYGNHLKNFGFDMFFSPTIIVEEEDRNTKTEENKKRIYSVSCLDHFVLPFEKEVKEVESFIKKEKKQTNELVALEKVQEKFSKMQHLENILSFVTLEDLDGGRGLKFVDGGFTARSYRKGSVEGLYLPSDAEGGVYKPELKGMFV